MTLGQKVRQARIRAGLTQEQAAGGHITRNMLSLIENDLSAPSMKTLEYLAAALGVTAGWLLADDASDEAAERLPRARAMLHPGSSAHGAQCARASAVWMWMVFASRNSARPSIPFSRPKPLCLQPPNGSCTDPMPKSLM